MSVADVVMSWFGLPSILATAAAIMVAAWWWNVKRRWARFPAGPARSSLLLGNIDLFADDTKTHAMLADLKKDYGDVLGLRLGFYPTVILNGYDVIKEALVDRADVFSDRPRIFFQRITKFYGGVINGNGRQWRELRKFTVTSLRSFGLGKQPMEQLIKEEVETLMATLDEHCNKPTDVKMLLGNSVSNIICCIMFGKRFSYTDPEFVSFMERLNFMFLNGGIKNIRELFCPLLIPALPFMNPMFLKGIRCVTALHKYLRDKIESHRIDYDNRNIRDFIDLYLQAEESENDKEVYSQHNLFMLVNDLFLAGSESVKNTLYWGALYMISHPEVQRKCHVEIMKVIGQSRPPAMSDQKDLPYVEATLLEIQRMSSTGALGVMRCVAEDVVLRGHVIPKGTLLLTNFRSVHYDPAYWTEPDTFDPGRWLDENSRVIHHEAFMPFAVGPRVCPGDGMAKMELFLFFATLLQRYELSMVDPANPPSLEGIMGMVNCPRSYELQITRI